MRMMMHRISTSAQMPRKGHKAANLPKENEKLLKYMCSLGPTG